MASRAEMIRSARRRVDARRDARNRANIRDQYRASYGRDLGKKRFAPTKQRVGGAGDVVLNTIRGAGGDAADMLTDIVKDPAKKGINKFKDAFFPLAQKAMKGLEALGANWQRSGQNREILGDVYTDDLRKSMMSDSDREFYEKYMRLGDMRSGSEAQYYYDEANKALQNAQITNRINYALGQPEFGFETTAPAAQAAFNETPQQLKERIDYSKLVDRMVGGIDNFSTGLEGTKAGQAFLDEAYKEADKETGGSLISDAIMNYRDPIRDMVAPTTMGTGPESPVTISDIPPELFIDESQNMTDLFAVMPETMKKRMGAFYEGASADSPYSTGAISPLYSMYPNYRADHPIFSTIGFEDMDEQELLNWGVKNPVEAEYFGFVPPEYPNRSIFE